MITREQYEIAAGLISCEIEVIQTVATIESSGSGFNKDGTLKILFEPHIFWKQLSLVRISPHVVLAKDIYRRYKNILYYKWKTRPYNAGGTQWQRLNLATQINKAAAYKATSWGKFQIMGFNHKVVGFDTVFEMVDAFEQGENEHLLAFVQFVMSKELDKALREKDWDKFAEGYNGPGYRQNNYHVKMRDLYRRLKRA